MFSVSFVCFTAGAANKRVLVTAFEPYFDRRENATIAIAESVQRKLGIVDIDVTVCVLPVVFDEAAKHARECYEKMSPPPQMVVSLGEGDCSLRLETAAQNLDNAPGDPDNMGDIRTSHPIVTGGPSSVAFGEHILEMYCSLPQKQRNKEVLVSKSPGGFVCNNTAYLLGVFFKDKNLPYSFIHTPSSKCASKGNIDRSAGLIARMIEPVITGVSVEKTTEANDRICTSMPTSVSEVDGLLGILNKEIKTEKSECEKEFLTRLRERMQQWSRKSPTTY